MKNISFESLFLPYCLLLFILDDHSAQRLFPDNTWFRTLYLDIFAKAGTDTARVQHAIFLVININFSHVNLIYVG